ncbi:hypothetical protein KFU94_59540 [Chloroflexi bacterium TSY]|nr:hypothetical protein [Chloroflexi bacterium TSY]
MRYQLELDINLSRERVIELFLDNSRLSIDESVMAVDALLAQRADTVE